MSQLNADTQARMRQMDESSVQGLFRKLHRFGPEAFVKVVSLRADQAPTLALEGYFTMITEVSGLTPEGMRKRLGLREVDLTTGAAVYRLTSLPPATGAVPRGYSSLIDGRPALKAGSPLAEGYTHGQMAWQAKLLIPVSMELIGTVAPGQVFDAPLHPRTQAMYQGLASKA